MQLINCTLSSACPVWTHKTSLEGYHNMPKFKYFSSCLEQQPVSLSTLLNRCVLFAASAELVAIGDSPNSGQSIWQKSISPCESQDLTITPLCTQHKTGFVVLSISLSWNLQAWQVFKESLKQHQSDLRDAYSSFLCNSIFFCLL